MEEATDAFGLIGSQIDGKYRVESVVGEGGFGVVYRATHERFDAPVAIKCLKVPPSFEKKAQDALDAQLREEGRPLLKLSQRTASCRRDHRDPRHLQGAGMPFLVLEWLEGSTLADDLRSRRRAERAARTLEEAVEPLTLPQKERAATEPRDRSALAVLDGDLEGALAALEPWRQSVAKEPDQQSHLEIELLALDIEREMGTEKDARTRAEGLLRKMVAWSEPNVGDWSLTLDRYRLFDGGMTQEEFAKEREAWAERVRTKWTRRSQRGRRARVDVVGDRVRRHRHRRGVGEASPGEDAEGGRRAVHRPLHLDRRDSRARLRAREIEKARTAFDRVATSCAFDMTDPLAATQTLYFRGVASEQLGDAVAARAAYERVLARWGHAKPASVTAALAKKRLAALPK